MKVYLDCDGAPVRQVTEELCQQYGQELIFVKNTTQHIHGTYAKVVTVDKDKEAADIFIANHVQPQDLVLTSDLGLAALILGKKGRVLNFSGEEITDDTVQWHLFFRHVNAKLRRQGIYSSLKKPAVSEKTCFRQALEKILRGVEC